MDTKTSNCVNYEIINRSGRECTSTVDANCKSKWKWLWLKEKDINGDYFKLCSKDKYHWFCILDLL